MLKIQKTDLLLNFDIFRVIPVNITLILGEFRILVDNYILKDLIKVNSIFEKKIKKIER